MLDFVGGGILMGDYTCNLYGRLENPIIRTTWGVDTSLGVSARDRWFNALITMVSAYDRVCVHTKICFI